MSEDRIVRQHEYMEQAIFVLTAVHLPTTERVIGAIANFKTAFRDSGPAPGGEPYVERIRHFFPLGSDFGDIVEALTEEQLCDVARALWEFYRVTARAYSERRH